ncbi:hypothetical protein [Pseudomonas sp. Irchel 3E19]|uniref:hypothetical protein n=1 Tax=Pseudomonas sp. Irchel 3E19 TaxID=2008981 RepID=UPI000BA46282|nr:hypothetical protein [Pseudomonas sp. Irchel 3E19]
MNPQISKFLAEKKSSTGTLSATLDRQPFFQSNFVLFHKADEEYLVFGGERKNGILLTVPTALEGDGPHKVACYQGHQFWEVLIDSNHCTVASGFAIVTFKRDGEHRFGVKGTADLTLPDGRNAFVSFDISNPLV